MNVMNLSIFLKDINQITRYYKKLVLKTKRNENIGSINEWIVDNYYMISEQEQHIKGSFFNKDFTKIKNKRKNLLYDLVYGILKVNDFQANKNNIFNALNVYQKETGDYFSYNEINLIAVYIRLAIISEIRVLSQRLNERLKEKDEVEAVIRTIDNDNKYYNSFQLTTYFKITKDMIKRPYYIDLLFNYLREMGPQSEEYFTSLNDFLTKNNISLKELIDLSNSQTAYDNFVMINLFSSLKRISRYEIATFYKNISYSEKILNSEKENIYSNLYESSKDSYRKKIIKTAKKAKIKEHDYAKTIVEKADKEHLHLGWFLFKEYNYKLRTYLYIFLVFILTFIISLYMSYYIGALSFILILIPISSLVIEFVSQFTINLTPVKSLFHIKFEDGLPKEYATMVVIPTIIKDRKKVMEMFDKLEVSYLSNKTDNIYFTLLGDCSSESLKDVAHDEEIMKAGLNRVNELNEKYGKKLFYFVYRKRVYSESEECFLGWERKRGALTHFNKLLLKKLSEEEKKSFFKVHTFDNYKPKIKYVITIDTEIKLVLNTALKLIETMAHPMNRPVLSKNKDRVVKGYGIMQPRINIDIEVTNKSQYSQLIAGLGGLDIYTTASFDLYQDIFNEGSFVGKGIYDLEVFDQVLGNTFPDNLILSHDLIEGNYLRCGFINDVELFDDYPSSYLSDASRRHRWNRGDWQIIKWLKKKVINQNKETVNNPIDILGKWKIFDNLRRSLIVPMLLLFIIYGFTMGNLNASVYVLFSLGFIFIPIFFYLLSKIMYRNKYDYFLKYYLNLIKGIVAVANRSFLSFAVLPYEAKLYIDSIIRSLYRMYISKKNLLNWITAEEAEKTLSNDLKTYLKNFNINYIVSIFLITYSFIFRPYNIDVAIVVSLVWFFAPFLLYILSRSMKIENKTLNEEERAELKLIAEHIWHYFDDLLTEDRNYLIPDNYQYNREEKGYHNTSSSNIGFSLTSIVSAYELGFISLNKALTLISNVIDSVEKLEKWHGHLYNWYNIYTMAKLNPYFVSTVDSGNLSACLYVVKGFLEKHNDKNTLYRVEKLIEEMDFSYLYNKDIDVLSVGFNAVEQVLLPYHYNNFASESRLSSYIAIAKGDVPYKHWFCLDKTLTRYKHYKGLVSWSGTAFEYFMPLIFNKTYNHTLLDETYYYACYVQKEFIKEIDKKMPWGISESAYSEIDDSGNYKYNSFGISYLKLSDNKRERVVISPYSSFMAISIDDQAVYNNIQKFRDLNMEDKYGFFEAYDYEDKDVVKNYYAHHQGMSLASLTNYLKDNIIQEYFHQDKNIQSVEMLLKEKVQLKTYIDIKISKYKKYIYNKTVQLTDIQENNELSKIPELGLLSNGSYTIVINELGHSLSKYKNLQINRYRKISDEDYGIFFYIRNLKTNAIYTNTYAPSYIEPESYKTVFASDRVKYIREDKEIITTTEITVVKDHNAEIRKLTFNNKTNEDISLEVTSYGEVIMSRSEEDIGHRTFNGVNISSEIDLELSSLIFMRKSRTKENTKYYLINRMFTSDEEDDSFEYETSRDRFIGRNRDISNPKVIINNESLSNSIGAPLDPIMSLRKIIKVPAGSKETLYLIVGLGKSREQVREIIEAYKDEFLVTKAFEMSTVYNNVRSLSNKVTPYQIHTYLKMLKLIFPLPLTNNKRMTKFKNNELNQAVLWKFGISGETPLVTVSINDTKDLGDIKEILQAYEFYKTRGLPVDIAIINKISKGKEEATNYIDVLKYHIFNMHYFENIPGNIYIINDKDITKEEEKLLELVSSIYLDVSNEVSLRDQIDSILNDYTYEGKKQLLNTNNNEVSLPKIDLYNNYGGFINNGREYLIKENDTPMPWINVIANPSFGTIISNKGSGFTYAFNSREYKLTKWSNDITSDPISEKIIINDHLFKPAITKHGFGYTTFYSKTDDYEIFMKVFVSIDKKIKFYDLKITNNHDKKHNIKLDFILNMVLGVSEEYTNRYLKTDFNKDKNMLYIKNIYADKFRDENIFITSSNKIKNIEDNIKEKGISTNLNLNEKESTNIIFMLGVEEDNDIALYNDYKAVNKEFNKACNYWDKLLSTITINTPDKTFNYVMNGWYLYQVYASRLYAKAALYQVGGAVGFRDQLQDVMSVIYSNQELARKQILLHAKHQFKEGDVLHWWHEELMFGSRTRFSDDYLWLVYVTSEYLKITKDTSILDERICFVESSLLEENESEKGVNYTYTTEDDTLYNHLKLCVNKALNQMGPHDIPLIGSGDWNDGMNKVGRGGKGESVFVGFFLYDLLKKMSDISKNYTDDKFSKRCLNMRRKLEIYLDKNTWDGSWYLRGFFDNGDPLGSRNNLECQIDLLSQSWSIISDIAPLDKRKIFLKEVEKRLIDKENKIIKLLTPPFKESKNNPGYIQDYAEGLRENGGQYTHAAIWYVLALLKENQIQKAYEYFQMINPINRTLNVDDVHKYKVEPYVIPADVYSNPSQLGRGGWTWYTGSASWAYKVALEEMLGFKKQGDTLMIEPKINKDWDQYEITYIYHNTKYNITVLNKKHLESGKTEITIDNKKLSNNIINLVDDKKEHNIIVNLK